ncbi:MAG: hypothetical protein ACFFCS_11805 [Candidatus Hodarchaeota archaeon]
MMIWDPVEVLLWGGAIMLCIVGSILYLVRSRQRKIRREKFFFLGFAVYLLFSSISNSLVILADFHVVGIYTGTGFQGDYSSYDQLYVLLTSCSTIMGAAGTLLLLLMIEYFAKRTRYVLTIISSSFIVVALFFPFELAYTLIILILAPILLILIILSLLMVTRFSQPEFKHFSLLILLGFVLATISSAIMGESLKSLDIVPLLIAPVLSIFASLTFISPLFIDPKPSSRRLFHVLIVVEGAIGVILLLITYIYYNALAALVIVPFIIYTVYRVKKTKTIEGDMKSDGQLQEFSAMFKKPDNLTDEEITFHKEHKICLVCKGSITGFTFICTCDALYCEKCAKALTELENACWSCNAPFDASRQVTLEGQAEKMAEIEERASVGKKFKK